MTKTVDSREERIGFAFDVVHNCGEKKRHGQSGALTPTAMCDVGKTRATRARAAAPHPQARQHLLRGTPYSSEYRPLPHDHESIVDLGLDWFEDSELFSVINSRQKMQHIVNEFIFAHLLKLEYEITDRKPILQLGFTACHVSHADCESGDPDRESGDHHRNHIIF